MSMAARIWLGIAPLEERMSFVRSAVCLTEELDAFALVACGYPLKENVWKDRFDKGRVHYFK